MFVQNRVLFRIGIITFCNHLLVLEKSRKLLIIFNQLFLVFSQGKGYFYVKGKIRNMRDTKGKFTRRDRQGNLPVVANRADTKGKFTCCGK